MAPSTVLQMKHVYKEKSRKILFPLGNISVGDAANQTSFEKALEEQKEDEVSEMCPKCFPIIMSDFLKKGL